MASFCSETQMECNLYISLLIVGPFYKICFYQCCFVRKHPVIIIIIIVLLILFQVSLMMFCFFYFVWGLLIMSENALHNMLENVCTQVFTVGLKMGCV